MEKFDLTFPEKNIWLVENFYESKKINIISGSLVIKKDFNVSLAEKTVNEYVRLNDAMRIKICIENNTPKQYISEYVEFKADKVNVRGKTEEEIEKIKDEYISSPINVINNLLFSYLLIDKGEGEGEIFLKAHHLICDGWSGSKMVMELANIYDKLLLNDNIFEPYPSYLAYINKENEYKKSDKFVKDEEFWKEYLKDFNTPALIKIEDVTNTTAKRYSTKLNDKLNRLILDYSKENKVSPYSIFMTALAIYLERITLKQDVVIATPILNRSNFAEKQMQGMFVSTMPVRFNIDETKTFKEICLENAKGTMTLFRHQRFPFSKILDNVKKENSDIEKIHDVMVSYQNARAIFNKENTYSMTWNFSGNIQDSLEIHIIDLNNEGILEVDYDYLVDKFEDDEIVYFAKRIETIIEEGLTQDKTVETMEIMSKEEKDKILYDFNNTKRDYPKDKTVIDVFEEKVKDYSEKVALTFEEKEMTYGCLNQKANKLASKLVSLGVKEGECVAISVDKSFELLTSIIAVLKIGAYYLPLELTQTKEKKDYMVKDTKCVLAITDNEEVYENIQSINIKNMDLTGVENIIIERSSAYTVESPVCVLYTSGTTGNPKGALIINKNITKLVLNPDYIEFKDTDTILQAASTNFDVSLFEFWGPLLNGGTCALLKKQNLLDSNYLNEYIKERNVTIAWITQALFSQIIDNKIEVFETLRTVFSGGDVMSLKHVNKLRQKYDNLQIINCYGPTECTTFTNTFDIKYERKKRVPLGKAISNTYGYVIDNKFRLLPLYTEGEYIIGGDSVALGYINNPKLTNEKFVKDEITNKGTMYKTGDVVRMLDKGIIDFVGRRDNQVKIRGYRIELDEIKNVILSIKNVKDAIVIIRENNGNKRIYAYYVASREIPEEEVIKYIKDRLAKHMVPYGAMQLESLPLNANGKVDRKNLPEISKKINGNKNITKTEKNILDIVKQNLQIETDIMSNLFEEGLDSLSVVNLVVLLKNEFNIDISTTQIMKLENIREIADYIDNLKGKNESENSKADKITSQQLGIYLEYMKNPDSTLYNIPFKIKLDKNKVDIAKLIYAINSAINNHEVFFTRFDVKDNKVNQVRDENIKYNIKEIYVTENEMPEMIKNFIAPFDIIVGPLANIKIYVTETNIYLLCDFHHLIFDGYSLQIFLNDIVTMYNGQDIVKEEKTYIDYLSNYKVMDEDIEYFKRLLEDRSMISMPYDLDNYDSLDYSGNKIAVTVENDIYEKLVKVCGENKITMNTLMQVVYMLTFSDFVKTCDITFGTAFANRVDTNIGNTIGMFVKTLPFRYVLNSETKIIDLLKDVQKDLITNYSHSSCAYEDLLKNLKRTSPKALFDTMFVCQNIVSNLTLNGEKIIIEEIKQPNAKFDITFEILPKDDNLYITVEYKTKAFVEDTIRNFVKKYIDTLNYVISNIENKIANIPGINILENVNNVSVIKKVEKVDLLDNNLTKTDKTVLEVFKELLEDKNLTVNDNFFENGGDSLIAMNLVAKLNSLGIEITYADVFKYNTPKLLSSFVEFKEKSRIYTDISKYDYTQIDKLLSNDEIKEDIKINGVLITGTTGFLGVHILSELIESNIPKIYCLIRKKNGMLPEERLRKNLEYYFGKKYNEYIRKRIFVVEEDENNVNLPLDIKQFDTINKNIDVVINSAAYVKHFGNKDIFEKVNIEGVNNLIKYCRKFNKRLVQISTISVSGNVFEGGRTLTDNVKPNTIFDESKLYVGQEIDNIYVLSKFIAERNILESIEQDELDAIILRVGNLMGRYTDGVFQQNETENAFINRIKTFANIGIIPDNIKDTPLEFTPVDLTAKAIVKLLAKNNRKVYHIYNINHISIDTLKQVLEKIGFNIEYKSKEKVSSIINNLMKDDKNINLISGIIQDLDVNKEMNYSSNIKVIEDITLKILKEEEFMWKNIDEKYLTMFFNELELNKGE